MVGVTPAGGCVFVAAQGQKYKGWIARITGVAAEYGFAREYVGTASQPHAEDPDYRMWLLLDPPPGLYQVCDLGLKDLVLIRPNRQPEALSRHQAGEIAWAIMDGVDITKINVDSHGRALMEIISGNLGRVLRADGVEITSYISRGCMDAHQVQ